MSCFEWILTLLLLACARALWAQVEIQEAWVATYDGPGADRDAARAVAVDPDGNVYVTGRSQTGGQWQRPFGGGPEGDIATLKYDPFGSLIWEARYDGTKTETEDDESSAIAVDASGNVYVTGHTGAGPESDYVTIKYGPEGVEEWAAVMDPNHLSDKAAAVEVDGEGSVYVTGRSFAWTGENIVTVKYDSQGTSLWRTEHYAGNGVSARPVAIARGLSGEIVVVGSLCTADTCDCITIKYDSSGRELWARTEIRTPSNQAVALALDDEGYVYLAGFTLPPGKGSRFLTMKYNPGGRKVWQSELGGDDDKTSEIPVGMAVDREGNLYVAGQSCGEPTCAFVAVKYDAVGVEVARVAFGDPLKDFNEARAMVFDSRGGLYLTGKSSDSCAVDVLTLKLDRDLNAEWVARLPARGTGTTIAVAADGAVVVAGETPCGFTDFLTVKYEPPSLQRFWRGDVNGDGERDLTDAVSLLDALFRGKGPLPCRRSADVDDDGSLALTDAIFLLSYLFTGGTAPDAASPGCAVDSTQDTLDCLRDEACR
ncbi:MAG: SBBP repeat-containing protein [Planctomycetes bacterium]|nr:SBBP repeat-containing protein [Planctomycetota bacterium]